MSTFSRRAKAIVLFIVILAAGYGLVVYFQGRGGIPASFTKARNQGAIIAEAIVTTSNSSTAALAKIDTYDKKGDYTDALALTKKLVSQSKDLRTQAVQLSTQIETMTKSLSGVKDLTAQQDALEAISSHLALINELVNYSGDLTKLLDTLQARFNGQPGTTAEVTGLVSQINTEINAINNFNSQAQKAMAAFNKIENKS